MNIAKILFIKLVGKSIKLCQKILIKLNFQDMLRPYEYKDIKKQLKRIQHIKTLN